MYEDYGITNILDVGPVYSTGLCLVDGKVMTGIRVEVRETWSLRDYIDALGWGSEEQYEVFI